MQMDAGPRGEPLDALTVADMCVDVVLSGNIRPQFNQVEQIIDNYVLELGGSANIFASQLVKLGGRAGVIGRIGHDAFGKFTLERLRSIGVDTSRVSCHPSLKTGLGVALAETRDRAILTYLGTIDAVLPADLPDNLPAACRHWHIASFFLLGSLRPYWSHWVQRCKEAGLSTSLDTNWDPQNRWDGVTELLPFIDVFLPNEAEALSLTGETDLLKAGKRLAGRGPLVVVKRGDRGATAFKGNKTWHVHPSDFPAVPTVLVDSVGAGDNFDAGFMRAWLLGRDVDECLGWAHRCAVASLASPGGIQGQLCELVR